MRRTYAEVADAAARTAGALQAAGIRRGDSVAVLCGNRPEALEFFLGCAWLGAVVVPINTAARGAQLEHMLTNSRTRLLVIEAPLVPALEMVPKPELLDRVWVLDDDQLAEAPADYCFEPMSRAADPVPAAAVGPQDTLGILYTSGTTGVSKGVCCPHGQFYWWGILVGEQLEITADDVLFTCLPLFHTNALNGFMQALIAGAQYKVAARFSASRFWRQAIEAQATVTYLLGAMVGILCNQPASDDDRSHTVRIALGPGVPASFHEGFRRRFGVPLMEGYGSTELNLVIGSPVDDQRPGWMGRVLPEFEAIVADEFDEPVADGTSGDLLVRPHEPFSIATGYFGMPEKTTESWQNLWFHTGDRVVRDADGWFRFLDRSKDAIRRRGENISSFEVEEAVVSHAAVKAAAAFPVPPSSERTRSWSRWCARTASSSTSRILFVTASRASPTSRFPALWISSLSCR